MTQPEHVPVDPRDRVRSPERIPPSRRWRADRPGEAIGAPVRAGARFGSPGPDQGFGLKLAHRFGDRLVLAAGEDAHDAMAGGVAVGLKRAAVFHRGPVIHDFELAFTVWGLLGGAPDDLAAFRTPLFGGAGHDYALQRAIADHVPESTLRMAPAQLRARLADWRQLLDTERGRS